MRHDEVLPHPEAAHIADDEGDLIPRMYARAQRRAVNGRVEALRQRGGDIRNGGHIVPVKLGNDAALIQRQCDRALPICKRCNSS